MNTQSKVNFDRALVDRRERYNPISNLTPESLTRQIEEFKAGYLVQFARTMEAIKLRDDTLQPVSSKREKAPGRRAWEIVVTANLPENQEAEAERHRDALFQFYDQLNVVNAVDLNEQGGVELLLRQAMQAVGYKYAVHHVVWRPEPGGLTAQLIYCPLWFFENRTGRLRFLEQPHTFDGVEMIPGEWLVTVGDGIMETSAVAYMFKRLPLKDWLIMSQDFGKPVIEGVTDAAYGSEEWNNLKEAVETLAADMRIVRSRSAEIKLTDLAQQGQMPYEALVERMDRRLAAIWRGGDLGTVSRADAVGAEGQEDETDLIEEGDCMWLTGTMNQGLDRLVIANVFGEGTKPLAYFKVVFPRKQDATRDIAIDTFLRDSGAPLGIDATLERYGRAKPEDGDELLKQQAQAAPGGGEDPVLRRQQEFLKFKREFERQQREEAANEVSERLIHTAVADMVGARQIWLAPLADELDRLVRLAQNGNVGDRDLTRFVEAANARLPELFREMKPAALAESLEAAMGTAALQAVRDGVREAANEEDGVWRTVNGSPVFIKKGQSFDDAVKERFGDQTGKESSPSGGEKGKLKEPNERPKESGGGKAGQRGGLAESAHNDVRGDGRAEPSHDELTAKRDARAGEERRRLYDWAEANDKLKDSPIREDTRGGEHVIQFPKGERGRVLKETRPDIGYGAGLAKNGDGRMATPAEYLDRINLANQEFNSNIRIEGVRRTARGPSIRTSMPFIKGEAASPDQISSSMRAAGYEPLAAGAFFHPQKKLLVYDLHPKNAVYRDGRVYPIDPVIQRVTSSFARELRDNPVALN